MAKHETPTRQRTGRVKDARGRLVTELDPVKMHLLNQRTIIPAETLQAMVDELLPRAKRTRLIQVLVVVFGSLFIVGGNVVYFRYFSSWKGLDPVNTTIYIIQIAVLLSGPVLAFRIIRSEYTNRVAAVMLRYLHCPHCGYSIRGLPIAPDDGTTVCPECGCAWRLEESSRGERG